MKICGAVMAAPAGKDNRARAPSAAVPARTGPDLSFNMLGHSRTQLCLDLKRLAILGPALRSRRDLRLTTGKVMLRNPKCKRNRHAMAGLQIQNSQEDEGFTANRARSGCCIALWKCKELRHGESVAFTTTPP